MSQITKEKVLEMIKMMPDSLEADIIDFCNEIDEEEKRITKAMESEQIVIDESDEETEKEKENKKKKENEEKAPSKEEKAPSKEDEAPSDKVKAPSNDENQIEEKKEKKYKSLKDIGDDMRDSEVLLEAMIESMTEFSVENGFSNKQITDLAKTACMLDELG